MIGVAGVLQRFGNARRRHVERRVDAGIEGLDCRAVTGPHLADDGEGRREEIPYSGAFTKKFGIETEPEAVADLPPDNGLQFGGHPFLGGPRGHGRAYHHAVRRSEEHTSELQSLMRISYAVFCLKK